jgi:hypothetical protein
MPTSTFTATECRRQHRPGIARHGYTVEHGYTDPQSPHSRPCIAYTQAQYQTVVLPMADV